MQIHLNIVLSLVLGSSKWSFSLTLPHWNPLHTSPLPHTRYMPRPSRSSRYYHPNNIGWGVQIHLLLGTVLSFLRTFHNIWNFNMPLFLLCWTDPNSGAVWGEDLWPFGFRYRGFVTSWRHEYSFLVFALFRAGNSLSGHMTACSEEPYQLCVCVCVCLNVCDNKL